MFEFKGKGWVTPRTLKWAAIIAVASLVTCPWPHRTAQAAEDGTGLVAGLNPDERPVESPSIRKMTKNTGWYSRSLTGLSEPYPQSFSFLEDQEAWYTPFTRPGMTGPYDLRGWHSQGTGGGN